MAQSIKRLSPRKVATEIKRGFHADGGGLYLQVSKFDTKSWVFRFNIKKRSREMGLGPLRTISLAEARDEALKCRKLLREGIDPIEQRKFIRGQAQAEAVKVMAFRACTKQYISSQSAGWHEYSYPNLP